MSTAAKESASLGLSEKGIDTRTARLGDVLVAFERWPAGDFSDLCEGLPSNACEASHWGYTPKGRWRVRTADGEEVIEAGQAYFLPPGHTFEVLEPVELVEFTRVDDPHRAEATEAFERNLAGVLARLGRKA